MEGSCLIDLDIYSVVFCFFPIDGLIFLSPICCSKYKLGNFDYILGIYIKISDSAHRIFFFYFDLLLTLFLWRFLCLQA